MSTIQNWKQLSSIQIGGVICLPAILIGQTLSQSYGFNSAILAIFLGNLVLTLLAFVVASMSYREKKTTIENASLYFGRQGSLLFAWAMLFSLVGWFGIQLNLMSQALLDLCSVSQNSPYLIILNTVLGLVMTLIGMYGLRALNTLSDFSIPVLGITLLIALTLPVEKSHAISTGFKLGGISMVIATAIAAVIDLPTFFRHAGSKKDAYKSVLLIFGLAIPLVELAGVYLATSHPGETIIHTLKGSNILWNCWVALFIILAGWTTNNTNLYSGAVSLNFIFKEATSPQCSWVFGLIGTFIACFNLLDNLEVILGMLGVGIGSMGAVIVTGYLMFRWKGLPSLSFYSGNLFAWSVGTFSGLMSLMGWFSISSIAILDAFLAASCVAILLLIFNYRKLYETHSIA